MSRNHHFVRYFLTHRSALITHHFLRPSAAMKPKSADVIRDKLVRVRELAEREQDLGPHAAGLTATDRFPVATFVEPRCASA